MTIEVERPDELHIWVSVPCQLPDFTQTYLIGLAMRSTDEICGFITRGNSVIPIPNVAEDPASEFEMDKPSMVGALTDHDVVGVYHSHPSGRPWPGTGDTHTAGFFYAQGCPWDYYIVTSSGVHRYEHKDRL